MTTEPSLRCTIRNAVLEDASTSREYMDHTRPTGESAHLFPLLSAGVVHEFNNLHGSILGHLELLRRQAYLSSPTMKMVDRIEEAATRAVALSEILMTFAKRTRLPQEQCDIAALVADEIALFQDRHADSSVEIVLTGDPLPNERVNGIMFQQLLDNLLRNALDAVCTPGVDFPQIHVHTQAEDDFLYFTVRDNGNGMAQDTLREIRHSFISTKGLQSGHGIGLGFCALIAELHGGGMHIHSKENDGTSITIHLPRSTQ